MIAVGQFLAGCARENVFAREKLSKTQKSYCKCVSPEANNQAEGYPMQTCWDWFLAKTRDFGAPFGLPSLPRLGPASQGCAKVGRMAVHVGAIALSLLLLSSCASPDPQARLADTKECIECDLQGKALANADLKSAKLNRANLSGADLNGANLSEALLDTANLSGANLSNADLNRAALPSANLSGANLSGASLKNAFLRNADFTNANLSNADFSGSDLSGAKLDGATQDGAVFQGAILPDGTVQP
ncbi:MAG TPA: pentapeptide repeat-containing protein [Thermoleptolyngbya sp. M55_K2018_002]|nr:pentapeptide repeat-containing protein [Thermoleptolyngbya sp. M55_K2018_002]